MTHSPVVTLRGHTNDDVALRYRLAAELDTWEERNPSPPAPLPRDRFDAQQAARADADIASFVIEADGEPVGTVGLFGIDRFAGHAEMGISLLPESRGHGIGTAAIRQVVEFGFVRINLRRIHLQAIASNAAALRAYERAGFVVEGRLREHAWVRGRYEDIVLMGILRDAP